MSLERREITIEGYSAEEILAMPEEHVRSYVFTGPSPRALRVPAAGVRSKSSCRGHELRGLVRLTCFPQISHRYTSESKIGGGRGSGKRADLGRRESQSVVSGWLGSE